MKVTEFLDADEESEAPRTASANMNGAATTGHSAPRSETVNHDSEGPFDRLDQAASWDDIFVHGGNYTRLDRPPDSKTLVAYKRPGAESDYSVKILKDNPHVAVAHSDMCGLPIGRGQNLTMGRVCAIWHHNGDERAAATAMLQGTASYLPAHVQDAVRGPDKRAPTGKPSILEQLAQNGQADTGQRAARPRVDVRNAALAADWLRLELGRGELSGIFRRDDLLVHTPLIGEEGYMPPADLGLIDAGPAQVRPITTVRVKSLIETRYHCWKTITVREGKESTKIEVPALFPQLSAQSACEAARLGEYAPHLRDLHGVTHTPTMRPDGSILDVPGYNADTGMLYLPDPDLKVPAIPQHPTAAEIRAAVELILEPIAEFPFVSEGDRATWIGLAFTPALRPLLPGPYQMGVITATNSASGKTKLTKMLTILHGGVQRGEMPRDSDELRKSITASLLDTTAPIITFDNVTGVVRSPVLESLLTSWKWTDRWLGQNKSVTATNDRLWMATGNNAQFGGDLRRRIATVALDPPEADHHLREFRIKDLDKWMFAHRGELLAGILTIARGWVDAGRPSKHVRSDDYAEWVKGLRGLMEWAQFPGTFGGSTAAVAVSTDDEEWHAFLVAMFEVFGSTPFTTKELVDKIGAYGGMTGGRLDAAVLPGDLADKFSRISSTGSDGGFRKSVGRWLTNREGRYAAKWKLRSAGQDGRSGKPLYVVCSPSGYVKP